MVELLLLNHNWNGCVLAGHRAAVGQVEKRKLARMKINKRFKWVRGASPTAQQIRTDQEARNRWPLRLYERQKPKRRVIQWDLSKKAAFGGESLV